ncbi:Pentatricopeptide repeat [Kalmanozyma brasiliensis GHG001]|uniref:Methyltransferase type 11 domain-containing protein n=1 Tax=Kalmanozyma brasiliensis (strain GHG001) TaxID=1365824 RepID=V5EUJ3_KALBG|nr:Pentatricopeptide repeat [Kalmanozyma brasiliensis GHG001]EST06843.1 Pentatricopeptide repeat [Kalmanozyma brasiliensis GHG001]
MPVSSAAKLASHLWRGAAQSAANAAHNSANSFRGAFQGASSGPASSTGSSASGWASGLSSGGSSAGAGAGGAKFHAGRGAHFSYQHTGRALSQASSTSNPDSNNKSNDDDDEARRQKAYKLRLDGQHPHDRSTLASSGHLTKSQMQVRFRHAFAAKQGPLLVTSAEHAASINHPEGAGSERYASTVASLTDTTDNNGMYRSTTHAHDRVYKDLQDAARRKDAGGVNLSIDAFYALPKDQKTTAGFNMAMESLLSIRKGGDNLKRITDVYSDMIQAGHSPNSRTYTVLVKALCARDAETSATPSSTSDLPDTAASSEDHFVQALELTSVAHKSRMWFDDAAAYNAVLSSCALRGDVDRALSMLDLLERSDFADTDALTFTHLIQTFVSDPQLKPDETQQMQQARKLAACKQVFDEFLLASQKPRWDHEDDVLVWSSLIEAHFALGDVAGAVKLFERILEGGDSVPPLHHVLPSVMIQGFLNARDTAAALHWFNQISSAANGADASLPSSLPLPDRRTLRYLIRSVALSGQDEYLEPLQRAFHVYLQRSAEAQEYAKINPYIDVVSANVASAQRLLQAGSAQEASAPLDRALDASARFFAQEAASLSKLDPYSQVGKTRNAAAAVLSLADALLAADRVVDAGSALTYVRLFLQTMDVTTNPFQELGAQLSQLSSRFMAVDGAAGDAEHASVRLLASAEYVAPVLRDANLLDEQVAASLAKLYRNVRTQSPDVLISLPLSADGWNVILEAFCFEELHIRPLSLEAFGTDGVPVVLNDLARLSATQASSDEGALTRPPVDTAKAVEVTLTRYGQEALSLLPAWATPAKEDSNDTTTTITANEETSSDAGSASRFSASTPATTPPQQHSPLHRQDLPAAPTFSASPFSFPPVQVIDTDFGGLLTSLARPSGPDEAPGVYEQVLEQMKVGNFAHPEGLATLIGAFGRLNNVDRMEELYAMAQHVLHALVGDPAWQAKAWFVVEDSMMQAFSHAGRTEEATQHRHRIIAAGGAPTATSYAALIATIRDTTDDASIAQELFDESQRFGVRPNAYLFNTVISKLSRARKADRALQLFDEMTLNFRIKPTSVTYGAVINACTRIGDEQRAVRMFEQMENDPSFKPRVPPYNTMMQYYIQSVPDRQKALVYYHKMLEAQVDPSAHTYKLLLDLYGAIEPVLSREMEHVFNELANRRSVPVQGTHWASLINCYGCMLNDLDRAILTFDSIASHPSSQGRRNAASLPDAVAFEALLAVFVAHGRTDLIRAHFQRMQDAGVKMTAYVANLLIRGYSMEQGHAGLDEARALFESMSEPAAGVAAVGNHPPRAHGAGAPAQDDASASPAPFSGTGAPYHAGFAFEGIQREPSTYEAMIRAELSHGHSGRAAALVDRMEARAFPPALIVRARALVSDATVSSIAATSFAEAGAGLDATVPEVVSAASRFTYGQTSPRLRHTGLYSAPFTEAITPQTGAGAMSVRHASTMAGSGAAAPAPGPPKPNSPFTIFDRAVKTLQKDRAAVRPSVSHTEQGHEFGADSTRGDASRETDYVRRAIAESLADRVQDIKRDFPTIVELGAGPGFLRHYLDPQGCGTKKIIMCDTSEALLNRDRHLDEQFGFEVERRVLDEEVLPFEEGTLDCVVVSGGLHWTNDLPGVLIQIRRALKPDGVFIAALCGGDTLFELRTSLQLAEQEREGGISPRISPMADTRDMASLLSRAGFTIPTVDVDEVSVGYPSMYELMHDLRDMGESNAVINRRGQLRRDTMLAAGAIYQAMHGNEEGGAEGEGGVPATFQLIFLIGWSPAPTQPKPLKRGSAKTNLKDVLAGQEGDMQQQVEGDMEEKQRQQWMRSMEESSASKNKK